MTCYVIVCPNLDFLCHNNYELQKRAYFPYVAEMGFHIIQSIVWYSRCMYARVVLVLNLPLWNKTMQPVYLHKHTVRAPRFYQNMRNYKVLCNVNESFPVAYK